MPVRLLLHPVDYRTIPIGIVASLAIHAAVIALLAVAARERPTPSEQVEELVRFILPPDRPRPGRAGAPEAWSAAPKEAPTDAGLGRAAPTGKGPVEPLGGDSTAAEAAPAPSEPETVLTELEVDTPVERMPGSVAPAYPAEMLRRGIEGSVSVTYIVDTLGIADSASIRVQAATDPAFVDAVRNALPRMRFRPALLGPTKVRQLVQQTFSFKIRREEPGAPPPPLTLRASRQPDHP